MLFRRVFEHIDVALQFENLEQVVARAKQQDVHALEILYCSYRDMVYSLAYSLTGSREDSEDILQEVFITVLTKVPSFRNETAFSSWLYKVTLNRARDHLRRRKQRPVTVGLDDDTLPLLISSHASNPEAVVSSKASLEEVHAALMGLPTKLRKAVVLRDVHGLSYREVSDILGIPVGTVKSRLSKGRLLLNRQCGVSNKTEFSDVLSPGSDSQMP